MPLILNGDGSVGALSAAEMGYLDGITSAVQTQINEKAPMSNASLTNAVLDVLKVSGGNKSIRSYEAGFSISFQARQDLLTNTSSFMDVPFLLWMYSTHGSRNFAMYAGTFGGYGGFITTIANAGNGTVLEYAGVSTGFGKIRVYNNNTGSTSGNFQIGALLFGTVEATATIGQIY